jgi:anaerobic selenocysteine-containing dehydrogenase
MQIPWCREIMPFPRVDINPETAEELGIQEGDWVWIETPRGKVKQRARLTGEVHPKVVSAQHGWWFPEKPGAEHGCFESNINVLCDNQVSDPFLGANVHRGLLCKITKVNGEEE